jgi:two-component system NtrC family sensor kinase
VGVAIQRYRLLLTLATMLVLTLLLCFKEELLQRKLVGLLDESRRSYASLQLLQEDLLQKEKLAAIGKLVAGAAHEINNPLTAILGYSSLVADDPQLNSVQRSTIAKIIAQARRTKSLVSSLLTFAKQTPMERSILDLNTVINNAIQLHELDRGGQNIKIVRNLQADLPAIWGDKNQLLQTCFHILDNAVEAMQTAQGDGTATLSTGFENGKVIFRCSDTGPGVADPSKIFDPFYTTKEVGKGSGLGLSACYGIVRDHGGEIKCENRLFGGAEFTLSFPAAEPERQAQAAVAGPVKEHK